MGLFDLDRNPVIPLPELPAGYLLTCQVYRTDFDCTNGGLTSTHDRVRLVSNEYKAGTPTLRIENGRRVEVAGLPAFKLRMAGGRIHAYPADVEEGEGGFTGWMFGGNFIHCSDSRFPIPYPIPVHDRRETWQQYDLLSQ
jgi:hypothetical protein